MVVEIKIGSENDFLPGTDIPYITSKIRDEFMECYKNRKMSIINIKCKICGDFCEEGSLYINVAAQKLCDNLCEHHKDKLLRWHSRKYKYLTWQASLFREKISSVYSDAPSITEEDFILFIAYMVEKIVKNVNKGRPAGLCECITNYNERCKQVAYTKIKNNFICKAHYNLSKKKILKFGSLSQPLNTLIKEYLKIHITRH